ncbi:hypothetical protein, partial [Pseudomonas inefficax]|uniref:hypothetical protein n=1 Tax=Pseudomonas inefficax TaxID=2078786 RepID=UPI003266A153
MPLYIKGETVARYFCASIEKYFEKFVKKATNGLMAFGYKWWRVDFLALVLWRDGALRRALLRGGGVRRGA